MTSHVATIHPAEKFDSESFREREQAPGFKLRLGRLKAGGSMQVQSAHFSTDKWDEKKARAALARLGLACSTFAAAELAAEDPPEENRSGARILEREDGTFDLEAVEVLAVGLFEASKGGKVRVTKEDIDAIAADTQANLSLLRPPAKLGHTETPFPDGKGAPALGWASNVYARGEKLLVDFTKVPSSFVQALRQGRWRTRSAELMRWKHPETGQLFNRVLKAVAWLGAEMPAVQSLADVVALQGADIDWDAVRASVDDGCQVTFSLTAAEEPEPEADPSDAALPGTETGAPKEPEPEEAPTEPETERTEEPMPEKTAEEKVRDEAIRAATEARGELVEATLELALATKRLTPADVEPEKVFAMENLLTLSAVRSWAERIKARPELDDETKELGTKKLPEDAEERSTERDAGDPLAELTGGDWLMARADQIVEKKGWDEDRFADALELASRENDTARGEYFSAQYKSLGAHQRRV